LATEVWRVADVRELPRDTREAICAVFGHVCAEHGLDADEELNAYGREREALVAALVPVRNLRSLSVHAARPAGPGKLFTPLFEYAERLAERRQASPKQTWRSHGRVRGYLVERAERLCGHCAHVTQGRRAPHSLP